MKVALAQLNFHTGNFQQNTEKIITHIKKAKEQDADLIIFPELAICGYPPRDFLAFDDFITACLNAIKQIETHCVGITCIVGAPSINPNAKGKKLFNSAYVLSNGQTQQIVHKTLLPTYDVFDEYRYFEPNSTFELVHIQGKKIALTICEDLWNVNDNPLYNCEPMQELAKLSPDLMVNIAASPYSYQQHFERSKILEINALRYKIPLIYVNHVGAQTELIFDGDSRFLSSTGKTLVQIPAFQETMEIIDTEASEEKINPYPDKISGIRKAICLGIKDYFQKLGLKKAILGLSGGIDSAVVFCLAVEALGAENVLPVLLPSTYTSEASNSEALQLAKNLGTNHKIISIEKAYQTFENILAPHFEGFASDVTEENLQSRSRAVILMALSNKLGYILLNTTNKSEMAVGYGTLYGDLCGGLSVIGDLYKTEVYQLAEHINSESEVIPRFIIDRPPSAELKDNQKDSDSLPEYHVLDPLLYAYIEERKSPSEIIALGFEQALVNRVLKMVNQNEWKRHQTAPIIRVSPKAFGMGRRMPIVAKYLV